MTLDDEINERLVTIAVARNLVNAPHATLDVIRKLMAEYCDKSRSTSTLEIIQTHGEAFIAREVEAVTELIEKRDGKPVVQAPSDKLSELMLLAQLLRVEK